MQPSTSFFRATFVLAFASLAACTGDGTLTEVGGKGAADPCYSDGGVCDGGAPQEDRVQVDCCDIDTDVQEALCEDLYGGTVAEGLIVEDTCDDPFGPEPEEPTDSADPNDPCAGLSGIELIICSASGILGPGEDDPCAGLEGQDALICQVGSAIGLDLGPTELVTEGPLAEVVNGLNALADIANGFNTLATLLGIEDLFGDLFGGGEETAGDEEPADGNGGDV